ncbi:COG2070 Dioxygenases related to 2-nitropropane dioxygenase [uncultured Caudovirales phage]|uniref:COG2070 Dioxygenases related to 2-nitropropane dioxygenase n=1 Tax=uncultured Caudovirales phage TaxID=2100421 RepID=A0A6J5TA90_9CAUD|nr:COG2070 Dioxygenases related to 2-nitropropane dioxygenase [uncultured Caudovirales phage]
MKTFTESVNCDYPIVAMAMNKVSDLRLAIAIRKAGGLPSLSVFNYFTAPNVIEKTLIELDLMAYREVFKDTHIIVSTSVSVLLSLKLTEVLTRFKVLCVELILDDDITTRASSDVVSNEIKALQAGGVMVFTKTLSDDDILPGIDGIVLKGPDGAGRGNTSGISLLDLFDDIHSRYPDLLIIPAGGISTAEHVKQYMDRGAWACGIGTLFAATEESRVSYETKLKMVEATSKDIQQLANGDVQAFAQNALVFGKVANDNFNNTKGLMAGVSSPKHGHIFVGAGIDSVTSIVPVRTVIDNLVKGL